MNLTVFPDKHSLARAAAARAENNIRSFIRARGSARLIAATGASQFEFLDHLTASSRIDWRQVEMFHLDEYIGLPAAHPASFRRYLRERLIDKTGITRYHLLDGEDDPRRSSTRRPPRFEKPRWTSLSSDSERMGTSHSTIRPLTLRPGSHTSSSNSTR